MTSNVIRASELEGNRTASSAAQIRDLPLEVVPRLRTNVSLVQQIIRQESWWILSHNETGISYRLDNAAYQIVKLIDGHRSVGEIVRTAERQDGSETETAEDVYALLCQLHGAELLQITASDLFANASPGAAQQSKASSVIKNPLAIKIALLDPDKFLTRTLPFVRRANNKLIISLAIVCTIVGTLLALQRFPELVLYTATRADHLSSVLLLIGVYPVIKAVHELAHAVSIKHYGGEVHEMGIMLLVFFPVPYIDASASATFTEKRQRIVVSSAGIIAELLLAAAAIILWANIEAGLLSDIALTTAMIGGISTLIFNGNPLLRFDGYFVLSDTLEIPNLASRSREYCLYLLKRAIAIKNLLIPTTARGEKPWLASYFFVSGVYRFFILISIAIFLINSLPLVGGLLAGFAIYSQIVIPTYKTCHYLYRNNELNGQRSMPATIVSVLLLVIASLLLFVPVPNWHASPGVVRMPDTATIRTLESGFVSEINFANNAKIAQNDVIARLRNDYLDKEHQRLQWHLAELEARRSQVVFESPNTALQIAASITATRKQLDDVLTRLEALTIRAPSAGQLQYADNTDWIGRYIEEGSDFAFVVNGNERSIITAVPESMIADIRRSDTQVFIRSAATHSSTLPAQITKLTPASTKALENSALGSRFGGAVSVDSRDVEGKQALEKVFHLELTPVGKHELPPGSSVMLRFNHASASVGTQVLAATIRWLIGNIDW